MRDTDASVPAPLRIPVMTVTAYSEVIFSSPEMNKNYIKINYFGYKRFNLPAKLMLHRCRALGGQGERG